MSMPRKPKGNWRRCGHLWCVASPTDRKRAQRTAKRLHLESTMASRAGDRRRRREAKWRRKGGEKRVLTWS